MKLPDPELLAFSREHLYYEFEMLFLLGQILARRREPQTLEDGIVRNACIESFALHLRVLADFFYPPDSPQPDDIIADHYVEDAGSWRKARPEMSERLRRGAGARANKEIAHLTSKRIAGRPAEKGWDPALVDDIKAAAKAFLGSASPNRLHPRVRELLSACDSVAVDLQRPLMAETRAGGVVATTSATNISIRHFTQ